MILLIHSDKCPVLWYLEDGGLSYDCETLEGSTEVLVLVLDNRGTFVCGAAVSDGL